MKVWTVTATAVYDHGCYGVFSTREAAEAHGQALIDSSDHHHWMRIDSFIVDEGVEADGRLVGERKPGYTAKVFSEELGEGA